MVEALLVPEGAQCISLGPQTPIEDIRRAALAHEVQVVRCRSPARSRCGRRATARLAAATAAARARDLGRGRDDTAHSQGVAGVLLVSDIGGTLGR
jgi:hypothetical protein